MVFRSLATGGYVEMDSTERLLAFKMLHRAVLIMGSEAALATYLGVSEDRLACWLAGKEKPTSKAWRQATELATRQNR
jgi:hypothetical protein